MAKKGEVLITKGLVVCDVVESKVQMVDPLEQDHITEEYIKHEIDSDGMLVHVEYGKPLDSPNVACSARRCFAPYAYNTGDTIYALKMNMTVDSGEFTVGVGSTTVWILTERANLKDTAKDILQKVRTLCGDGAEISLEDCELIYRQALDTPGCRMGIAIYDSKRLIASCCITKIA